MQDDAPILMAWTGETLEPASPYWGKRADKQLVVGARYLIQIQHERSSAAHRAYFAAINEAFQNLAVDVAEKFGSPDALRKAALIATGYRDERTFVARSNAEARRIAAFVKPTDDYAVVGVHGATVVVLTAKSQSYRAMGRDAFNTSKERVLDYIASLIGATIDELKQADAA